MKKKALLLSVVMALLLVVSSAVMAEDEIIHLRYVGWAYDGDDTQDQQVRIDAFMERYPNIHVTYEFIPQGEYDSQMMTWAAAGNLPDILWVNNNLLYVRNGWLRDLTPFLEADPTFDPDMFFGNTLEPGYIRGRYFSLPFQLQAGFLVVNLDLIHQMGLRLPSPDWTTDDLYAFCQRLNRPAENYYGMEDPWIFWAHFPPAFSEKVTWDGLALDGSHFLFDDPDVAEAFKWATDFERNNAAVSIGLADGSRPDPWNHDAFREAYGNVTPFDQSKAAMHVNYSWSFNWQHENFTFNWDIIPYPKGPARQVTPLIVDSMGISSTTEYPEEAFAFVRWMTYDVDAWKTRMQVEKPVPYSLPTIEDDEVWELYFANEAVPSGMRHVYETLPNGMVEPARSTPGIPEVWDIIGPARDQYRMGLVTYDDIFPTIVNDQANQLMREAYEANERALDQVLGE